MYMATRYYSLSAGDTIVFDRSGHHAADPDYVACNPGGLVHSDTKKLTHRFRPQDIGFCEAASRLAACGISECLFETG